MNPDDLAVLHAKCFEMPRPWSAEEFASLLLAKGVFLLCNGGGFLLGREVAGEAELLTLAIDPVCQRQGYGVSLLENFENEAAKRGAVEAFLEVAQNNEPASALYCANGYRESGRRSAYYRAPNGDKITAILLRKPLI